MSTLPITRSAVDGHRHRRGAGSALLYPFQQAPALFGAIRRGLGAEPHPLAGHRGEQLDDGVDVFPGGGADRERGLGHPWAMREPITRRLTDHGVRRDTTDRIR